MIHATYDMMDTIFHNHHFDYRNTYQNTAHIYGYFCSDMFSTLSGNNKTECCNENKNGLRHEKTAFCICEKTKAQISCAVTAQLISVLF